MNFHTFQHDDIPAKIHVSHFETPDGPAEYHLTIRPTRYADVAVQLNQLLDAYRRTLDALDLPYASVVFRRFFCSDLVNQADILQANPATNPDEPDEPCAISLICQPPLPPARIALWAYHVRDPHAALVKSHNGDAFTLHRPGLDHLWSTGLTCTDAPDSHDQAHAILESYTASLHARGLSLADNLVRTWFFVQNVDANYGGFVNARRDFFARHGLTSDTHFIASTGVEGAHADIPAKVICDAYAIANLQPEQVQFLAAPEHLSPTAIYGVTFERGTAVSYRDRRHVLLSGTASIDDQGHIVHPGDLARQLDRTVENMDALLAHAGAGLEDMAIFLAYIRDPADYEPVRQQMRKRFGDAPVQVLLAKVCRPGWLVELEGHAIIPNNDPNLPAF